MLTGTIKLPLPVNERDHMTGLKNAPITVVTYGDYLSFNSHLSHRAFEEKVDGLLKQVRFVYRHFPLVKVHPQSLRASEAAEAAAAQGKFWEMHRLLYSRFTKLSDPELRHLARKIGLDIRRYDSEMESRTYQDQILKGYYTSIVNGISGAPTTFINDVLCPMSREELLGQIKTLVSAS